MRSPLLLGICSLLIVSCVVQGPPKMSVPSSEERSSEWSSMSGAVTEDFTNEATPKTGDSLEVSTTGTGSNIQGLLTPEDTIRFGKEHANTLFEYFDYDCVYCREFELESRPWIDEEYLATGHIHIERVFVPMTTWGRRLALAAICAGEQQKFNELDALLLREFPLNETGFSALISRTGLTKKTFNECMENTDRLPEERRTPNLQPVERVPAFFLTGKNWEGVMTEEELRKTIEEALDPSH